MHRLTARLLLILLLVGVFAPVALAISATAPHACCLRKAMHNSSPHNTTFHAPASCCNHDCCRPLTVSHWAELSPPANACAAPAATTLQATLRQARRTTGNDPAHSGRAPPQFSIT